jgi:hypothetical protein
VVAPLREERQSLAAQEMVDPETAGPMEGGGFQTFQEMVDPEEGPCHLMVVETVGSVGSAPTEEHRLAQEMVDPVVAVPQEAACFLTTQEMADPVVAAPKAAP